MTLSTPLRSRNLSPGTESIIFKHVLYLFLTGSDLNSPNMPMEDAVRKYKFIIVIDGNCDAWRLQELLGTYIAYMHSYIDSQEMVEV